jgi:hypothetical protein
LYYTPRPDELPESTPDIAFLLGESDAPFPLPIADLEEEDKPVRILCDWAVFDARPSKAKGDCGALALALVSLNALDDVALESTDVGCAPEGAGDASPYRENEEDAGQEDDGDYDNDDGGSDEQEGVSVSVRLRLGAILRYTIDYTKRDEYVLFIILEAQEAHADALASGCAVQPDIPGDNSGLVHPRRPCARVPRALRAVLPCAQNSASPRVRPRARPKHSSRRLYQRAQTRRLHSYGRSLER